MFQYAYDGDGMILDRSLIMSAGLLAAEAFDPASALGDVPRRGAHGGTGGSAVFSGAADCRFDDARAMRRTIQQVIRNVVDVDLHPARPGRGSVAGQLPDTNVDKSPRRTFTTHLIAEEPGAGTYTNGKIKYERLAVTRRLGIEREVVLCLQAVEHADNGALDDDSQIDLGLIRPGHAL